jgi:hypothetical protein
MSPHCNQEQMRYERPRKRATQYTLKGEKQNHSDMPKKIGENKLKTNSIIVNSFYNI